jgi:hypothetical protein
VFDDQVAVGTGPVLRCHICFDRVVIVWISQLEFLVPWARSQKFIQEFALLIAAEVVCVTFPGLQAKETKISKPARRTDHSVDLESGFANLLLAFRTFFAELFDPV